MLGDLRGSWWGRGGLLGSVARWSGQLPGPSVVGEAEGEQAAQVEGGGAVVQPGVVLRDSAVGDAPVAAGEPGDGSFDHGSVGPVGGLERLLGGAGPVLALQRVVLVKLDGSSGRRRGAAFGEWAAPTGRPEDRVALRRQGAGDPVRAGQGSGGRVVGEVVDGEPAGHGRAGRPGLDDRGPGPFLQGGQHGAGAVGGVTEHLHRPGVLVDGGVGTDQVRPDRGVAVVRPGRLGQAHLGGQPGVRLDHHMGLEPVPVLPLGLVGVAGIRVHGGDHPLRCGPLRGAPPPIGAIGALGGLDVLAGDQRQQRHRLRRRPTLSSIASRSRASRSANASVTRALTSASRAPGSSHAMRGFPVCV